MPKNIPISHEPQAPTCLGLNILIVKLTSTNSVNKPIVFLWRCCRQRWSSRVNPEQAVRLESRVPLFTPRAWAVDNRKPSAMPSVTLNSVSMRINDELWQWKIVDDSVKSFLNPQSAATYFQKYVHSQQ